MPLEQSHGKARVTMPRASDLAVPGAAPNRFAGRDSSGRFAAGNRITGRGRGWRKAIRDLAPQGATDREIKALASDSAGLFRGRLAELPDQGPTVSALVAEGSRCTVLSAYLAQKALAAGLETAQGRALLELSVKLGQRAERSSVTALDISTRLAARAPVPGKRVVPAGFEPDEGDE